MLVQYTNENQRKLADILKNAVGSASTYVIPDLQRPYVWKPDQIILLVDSLFRRWPFGSILTWLVKSDSEQDKFGVPNRAFYREVSRTDDVKPEVFGKKRPPETYTMVLDGQQRLQSLILALASEDSLFSMNAEEWNNCLDSDTKKGSVSARLYIDFSSLKDSLEGKSVSKVIEAKGIAQFLKWRSDTCKADGILLSKLWNETDGKETRTSDDWIEDGEDIFIKYRIEEFADKKAFAQLLALIGSIRKDTNVPVLEIKAFGEDESKRESYNDAIVNIFTRLNTAGRTLSKEEITLAWLKTGWTTGRENAEKELSELLKLINGKTDKLFEMDDLVRYLSFIWGVLCNNGKLIESQDLLNGNKVKPIAGYISDNIKEIQQATENALTIVEQSKVLDVSNSKNSLIVFMTWYFIISSDPRINKTGCTLDKTNFQKDFDEFCEQFLNRWVFISQWSGDWNSNAQTFFLDLAKRLHEISGIINNDHGADYFALIKSTEQKLISDELKDKAKNRVNTISAKKRSHVSQYRPMLWIWHRLDPNRWKYSKIELKLPRERTVKLEVDHTVAHDKWVKEIVPPQVQKDNEGVSITALEGCAPRGFLSRLDANAFINSLGNMSLLNKSFNSSKNKEDMKTFILEVKEFKDGKISFSDWESSLLFDKSLVEPSQVTFDDIVNSIKERDLKIREELLKFIDGLTTRHDD